MNRKDFWSVIDMIDQDALEEGDDALAIAPLVAGLACYSPRQLRRFEEHLARVLYSLDRETLAAHAGRSAGSADAFLYCRCYVVAKGKATYERVLMDATAMPTELHQWCEPLLYAAAEAWATATGRPQDEWNFHASVSYETGSNTANWPSILSQLPAALDLDPFMEPKLERAVSRAGHAFRAKQYEAVVKLLTLHEPQLSAKQLAMLVEARSHWHE